MKPKKETKLRDKLAMFFMLLGMGHDIEYAMDIACHKTRKYGKYREE